MPSYTITGIRLLYATVGRINSCQCIIVVAANFSVSTVRGIHLETRSTTQGLSRDRLIYYPSGNFILSSITYTVRATILGDIQGSWYRDGETSDVGGDISSRRSLISLESTISFSHTSFAPGIYQFIVKSIPLSLVFIPQAFRLDAG